MTPILLSGPATEPVSLTEAKAWLRIDNSADDELVAALVTSARLVLEAATRKLFLAQTWRLTYDSWPASTVMAIPLAPILSLVSIKVYDADEIARDVPPEIYRLDANPLQARLAFASAPPTPARALAGIEMELVAGYGVTPQDVPEPLRLAIRMLSARWYENRGDAANDTRVLPAEIAAIVAPYMRPRLA